MDRASEILQKTMTQWLRFNLIVSVLPLLISLCVESIQINVKSLSRPMRMRATSALAKKNILSSTFSLGSSTSWGWAILSIEAPFFALCLTNEDTTIDLDLSHFLKANFVLSDSKHSIAIPIHLVPVKHGIFCGVVESPCLVWDKLRKAGIYSRKGLHMKFVLHGDGQERRLKKVRFMAKVYLSFVLIDPINPTTKVPLTIQVKAPGAAVVVRHDINDVIGVVGANNTTGELRVDQFYVKRSAESFTDYPMCLKKKETAKDSKKSLEDKSSFLPSKNTSSSLQQTLQKIYWIAPQTGVPPPLLLTFTNQTVPVPPKRLVKGSLATALIFVGCAAITIIIFFFVGCGIEQFLQSRHSFSAKLSKRNTTEITKNMMSNCPSPLSPEYT